MNFCGECGMRFAGEVRFCTNCGQPRTIDTRDIEPSLPTESNAAQAEAILFEVSQALDCLIGFSVSAMQGSENEILRIDLSDVYGLVDQDSNQLFSSSESMVKLESSLFLLEEKGLFSSDWQPVEDAEENSAGIFGQMTFSAVAPLGISKLATSAERSALKQNLLNQKINGSFESDMSALLMQGIQILDEYFNGCAHSFEVETEFDQECIDCGTQVWNVESFIVLFS